MSTLRFKPRVKTIDANVCVGGLGSEKSPITCRGDLISEMDRHGIDHAVIYHGYADKYSAIDGNELLMEWLGDDNRLIPQWSVLPIENSLTQLDGLYRQGLVYSARLFNTRSKGLPFRDWSYGSLLSWLNERNIPLWIPLPDADAHELVTTLGQFPDLVSVMVGAHYSHTLWIKPILSNLRSAYIELSRFETMGHVEDLVKVFGAERFVYGSWYPYYAMGPVLFYLHHTDLTEKQLKLICSENIKKLMNWEP